MLSVIQDSEIFGPVITPITVDMMDVLGRQQRSSENLFHYMSVRSFPFPAHQDRFVSATLNRDFLPPIVARARAILSFPQPRTGSDEWLSAGFADKRHLIFAVSRLSDDSLQTFRFSFIRGCEIAAAARAILSLIWLPKISWSRGKWHPAKLAHQGHIWGSLTCPAAIYPLAGFYLCSPPKEARSATLAGKRDLGGYRHRPQSGYCVFLRAWRRAKTALASFDVGRMAVERRSTKLALLGE